MTKFHKCIPKAIKYFTSKRPKTIPTLIILFLAVGFWGCSNSDNSGDAPDNRTVETDSTFGEPVQIGRVQLSAMDEISGIAASRQNAELLWAHNDSGDKPRLFLIRQTGELVATYLLPGIKNIDWEDLAIGPGPDSTRSFLYIADIGNNRRNRQILSIYRVPEPYVETPDSTANRTLNEVEKIEFRYPKGPHNAETLFLDPSTRDLYIVTKNEKPEQLYRLPYPQSTEQVNRAVPVGSLSISGALGGELSADGRLLLIKTQQQVLIWHLAKGDLPEAIAHKRPRQLPYREEPQGEALTVTPDGSAYFTISEADEKGTPYIYRYPRKN